MANDIQVLDLGDERAGVGLMDLPDGAEPEEFRDSDLFEELEAEFRKLEIDGPAAVKWNTLNPKTIDVLATRSKDLVLATRLAYGLFLEEGYGGLAVSIIILRDMAKTHWETMIPPARRERGRAGAYDWFAEKISLLVETTPPSGPELVKALICHDALVELDETLEAKFTKSSAALGPLIRALRPYAKEARTNLEAEAAKAAEPETAETSPAPASPEISKATDQLTGEKPTPTDTPKPPQAPAPQPIPNAAQPPVISTDGPPSEALQALMIAATKTATALRQQNPADPTAYQCARFALWGRVSELPPNQSGKTSLPPPQKSKLQELAALQSAGNYQSLISAAESAFVSSPFWLDAQYMLHESMSAAGDKFDAARRMVAGELAGFVQRFPDLATLSFSDGTPFADAATRDWLSGFSAGSGSAQTAEQNELDGVVSKATGLVQGGKAVDGLHLLQSYARGCPSERDWFKAQIKLADICLRFEILAPLYAQLASLRSIAVSRDLKRWEPDLIVPLYKLSWQALVHKNARQYIADAEAVSVKAEVMETLSVLDISAAAALTGKK
ncbi:type VI secretion system protein VasJ [Roseibium hamelinense]|uniref:Type VI secretion system protein VasJ n=1 Tax=Roseibium hamelinense TaxID=150831 RepID=A0A562SEA3_9HYPH|nr:type VI secretion system protein TssA [Roseibium hamelinense]MTI42580.1 type VI secretion system protein TssA [Roseibium hamelinense]TWI79542.1 type VI secretion system protein VasJ [Roseibium hamelinense]